MARARLITNPTGAEFEVVGRIIMAAWLKSLPDASGGNASPLDAAEIAAALTNVLQLNTGESVVVVIDDSTKTHIIVPRIPSHITTKEQLVDYLHDKFNNSVKPNDHDNPFNPKNQNKHGTHPSFKKRSFAADFGDATLFGCGR